MFHYLPLHLSDMRKRLGGKPGDCPVTEDISERLLRLPFYNQLLDGLGLGAALAIPLQIVPSNYRAMSYTLHSNPLRKVELSASWTRSKQNLAGLLTNDFELLNVFATYHFRKIQFETGYIRSNQMFLAYPQTLRGRFYVRIVRTARFL